MKINTQLIKWSVQIGREGVTSAVINEIINQLKKKKVVKVKVLRSVCDVVGKKEFAQLLAEKTNSELVKIVGFMIVLKKK